MASPPPFDICDDFDLDDNPATATATATADRRNPNPPPPRAAPTPNGLNDRLLRLNRSRPRPQNPNPNPVPPNPLPPPPPAEPQDRKVKLAGRRRLCKLSSSSDDGDSIQGILNDLTTRLDSLSVHRPKANPRSQVAPLPCAINNPEEDHYDSAASSLASSPDKPPQGPKADADQTPFPLDVSSSDEVTVLSSGPNARAPQPSVDEANDKGRKATLGVGAYVVKEGRTVPKPSSFVDCEDDDDEEATGAYAFKEVSRKALKASSFRDHGDGGKMKGKGAHGLDKVARRVPNASKLADYDGEDDDAGNEKENHEVVQTEADEIGWEKTEDFKMEPTGSGLMLKPYKLPGRIFKILYPHQREGLRWLWVLHCRGTGGILGDDMGLGKTMQVSAFLAGLFHSRLIKRVLIVAPKTLLTQWIKELSVVGLKEKIREYSGPSANVRNYELQYCFKEGGVLLTTYDIVRNNYKHIRGDFYNNRDDDEEESLWNYVILDEGHIIKNPLTQRAKSLSEIPCVHRIVISGTPIQNNLKEMWALFYFCCPEVLGDKDQFKTRYEMAIIRGNDKNATNREKHVGSNVAKELRERIKPYFLRRMKSEVFLDNGATEDKKLSKKNELIIWLKLTSCQRQLYEAFLNSDLVHSSMQGSPLAAITILKKICDHPLLLTKRAAEGILEGMDGMLNNQEMGMVEKMAMNLADMAHDDDALQVGQDVSCKLSFIMSLLRNLVEEGHHVLIFSQTRKMLNLIQEAILLEGYRFLRIDGTTKISERERIVKDFQEGPGAPIFLLTTQVGGLGLTLTKAARVIVVDPAWNPSTDNQSVDRAYRIGQTKDVIVYRLMTSGTIEEKIYKLQVFKGALFRTATEQKEQTRYFSKRDIQELFSLPEQGFDVSLTQKQMQEEHGQQLVMDESLTEHIQFLEQQGIAGVSHHSLLFSKTAILPTLNENDALDSNPRAMPTMMSRQYYKGSSSDYVANGAAHAFKPKDERFTPRTYSPGNTNTESPEDIKAKINRLSQTLANSALVSRLPDGGEKIRRQIGELDEKLTVIESSPEPASSEVVCLDDLSADMQNILSFNL